jgi:hypothetical protein
LDALAAPGVQALRLHPLKLRQQIGVPGADPNPAHDLPIKPSGRGDRCMGGGEWMRQDRAHPGLLLSE